MQSMISEPLEFLRGLRTNISLLSMVAKFRDNLGWVLGTKDPWVIGTIIMEYRFHLQNIDVQSEQIAGLNLKSCKTQPLGMFCYLKGSR